MPQGTIDIESPDCETDRREKVHASILSQVERQADRLIELEYHSILGISAGMLRDDILAAMGTIPKGTHNWPEVDVLVVIPHVTFQKQATLIDCIIDHTSIPSRSCRDIIRSVPVRRPYIIHCVGLGTVASHWREFQCEASLQKRRGLTLHEGLALATHKELNSDLVGLSASICNETRAGAQQNIPAMRKIEDHRYVVVASSALGADQKMHFPSTIKRSSY